MHTYRKERDAPAIKVLEKSAKSVLPLWTTTTRPGAPSTRRLTCFDPAFQGLLLSALDNFIGHKAQGQALVSLLFDFLVFLSSSRKDDQIFVSFRQMYNVSTFVPVEDRSDRGDGGDGDVQRRR